MLQRYSRPDMAAIWTEENKFNAWLKVEILSCEAWSELGVIPKEDVQALWDKASFNIDRIYEIEQETRHDVIAFTRAVSETLGAERKWVHYGLTSTDVVDTALGYLLRQANEIIEKDLLAFIDILRDKAVQYKSTPMMGRTHGVHAEPTTFGLKMALWHEEMKRNLERFRAAADGVQFGKISGAVGTYANADPFIEQYVCGKLGTKAAPISTQTLQRDRHAHYVATIGLIGTSLDKFATEIRALQKSEFREVEEPFAKGQKGSSAMPHKRNPIGCESISGLARVIRGHIVSAYENVPLWHERDISHSSVERIILPDSTILIDYMLNRLGNIIKNLTVFPDNMLRNMRSTYDVPFSGRVMTKLIDKGLSREQAYDTVQPKAMQAWEEQRSFRDIVESDAVIREQLTAEEIADCFDPSWHLKHVDTIFERLGLNE
ncbi:adenylosuccinate lyase [Paenibacillus hodogayensis]|uniref:Adenylosuccinate lyase n=1 Tax=Paenibacillus hodogayensis TaxID=279208 RepID=A0ABV5W8B7_9BACL